MRFYELMILIDVNYENIINSIIDEFCTKIKSNINNNILKIEKIGIRKLSYLIKKNDKAFYLLINIECDVNFIKNFEKDIKMNEFIIRYIILKTKKPIIKLSKLSKFNK